jgi:hypothetical protein
MIRSRVCTACLVSLTALLILPAGAAAGLGPATRGADPSNVKVLDGVSCISAAECWAVGAEEPPGGGFEHSFIQSWNGDAWATMESPAPSELSSGLLGISCPSALECWAVGGYLTPASTYGGFIERWDGASWTLATPSYAGTVLDGVTCVSTTDCWAVGTVEPGVAGQPTSGVIEQWNGTAWNVGASASEGVPGLEGIACVSAADCWASGTGFEHWNGTTWTVDDVLQTGPFSSVACTSATQCWAVESNFNVIEDWNGTSWTGISLADTDLRLSGLTCASATECWAVGTDYTVPTSHTAVEGWNGSTWASVASPDPLDYGSITYGHGDGLAAVTCVAATECVAVGSNVQGLLGGVHEAWNGTSWTATLQQDTPGVTYDRWEAVVDPSASGGILRETEVAGETASLAFSGTAVTWLAMGSRSHGIASVSIDGVDEGNVDLYTSSSTEEVVSKTYAGLAPGPHTIVITATGTKDASSTGVVIDLDAFQVGTSVINATSPEITYDAWAGAAYPLASGGSYRGTSEPREVVRFTFVGTGVDWITATGPSGGMARVTIDGAVVAIVDLYSSTAEWQVVEPFSGLTASAHTLTVTVVSSRNHLSTGTTVVVDAFVIHS